MRVILFQAALCALCLLACARQGGRVRGDEPTDSLVVHTASLYREYGRCDAGGSGCMMIAYRWVESEEYRVPALRDSLQAFTLGHILAARSSGAPPAATPEAAADALGAEYLAFLRDNPDSRAGWHVQVLCDVLRNDGRVLSVSVDEESYLGGAHSNEVQQLRSFDMARARTLRLRDILCPGKQRALRAIAERAFRDARSLAAGASLEKEGFWFANGDFTLTENFTLMREGLWLRYNAYDVAPYALGPTDVVIPYTRLNGLLDARFLP
jgi:hypothetical protein